MDERVIFERLFGVAAGSHDPEGVVAACLVRSGEILASSASSDDGSYHAEYLVIERAKAEGIAIGQCDVLYTTLEPCSGLLVVNGGVDCTTWLIQAGVRHVVFAARDPEHSYAARQRFETEGRSYRQIEDDQIVRRAAELFNSTVQVGLKEMKLPRKNLLPPGIGPT